jgi:hypothetical protein
MKEERVMGKIFSAVIMLGLLLGLQATGFAAPQVNGFLGVPWGSSSQQVAAEMAKNSFTLLDQRDFVAVYQGTFAGRPAEIEFFFYENFFYKGRAEFTDTRRVWRGVSDPDARANLDGILRPSYMDLKRLYVAKYGSGEDGGYASAPNDDSYHVAEFWRWENLPTTATPSAPVGIKLAYGTTYAPTSRSVVMALTVEYSIGEAWAGLKADKNGI